MRLLLACLALIASAGARELGPWVVEQAPGGQVTWAKGMLDIKDANGCTVWLRQGLTSPAVIDYDATVVSRGGPFDRVSDLNCFWMAQQPGSKDAPFAAGHERTGKFSDYDSLATYYVGCGGNYNSTTRFRRYDGHGARPLRPEDDRRDAASLLVPNHTYHIRLVAKDGVAEYYRDGERLFSFRDPAPLTRGYFGIRTVKSHLIISQVRVTTGSVSFQP